MESQNALDSQLMERLREPFPPTAIEWRPGATKGKRAQALPYVDSRIYMERLDEVAPGWTDEYTVVATAHKIIIICGLCIEGVWRYGVGEAGLDGENAATSADAQAFKRACTKFGLGRYLYSWPRVWEDYDPDKRALTPEAYKRLGRGAYGGD